MKAYINQSLRVIVTAGALPLVLSCPGLESAVRNALIALASLAAALGIRALCKGFSDTLRSGCTLLAAVGGASATELAIGAVLADSSAAVTALGTGAAVYFAACAVLLTSGSFCEGFRRSLPVPVLMPVFGAVRELLAGRLWGYGFLPEWLHGLSFTTSVIGGFLLLGIFCMLFEGGGEEWTQ